MHDWQIVCEVEYDDGWQERIDTRLLPGETRLFSIENRTAGMVAVRFSVNVIPDYFYKGVYRSLLEGDPDTVSRAHLEKALAEADANDYLLYRESIRLESSSP